MSAFVELTPELLAGFLDEAPSYLVTLEEGLLAFEQQCAGGALKLSTPADQERMNEIFRAAHSLKGASASLGFDRIRDLTHVMESLFDQVRHGMRELQSRELQPLFTAVDHLRALVDEIAQPGDNPVPIDQALSELSALVGNAGPGGKAPTTTSTGANCEIALVDPALLSMFVQSTAESLDALGEHLLALEQRPDDGAAVNEAFRDAHNIKGASGAVQCTPMHRLTHDMETVLDRVRSREITIDSDLITELLAGVDRLRLMLDCVRGSHWNDLFADDASHLFRRWTSGGQSAPPEPSPAAPATAPAASASDAPTASADDFNTTIQLRFPPGFSESPILACIIANRLQDLGTSVRSEPCVDNLKTDSPLDSITYWLQTDTQPAGIERIIRAYAVTDITVSRTAQSNPTASATTAPPAGVAPAAAVAADAKPATPQGGRTPENAPAPGVGAEKGARTLRVDLERLDQLMNLGGELVITKARFVEVSRKLGTIFSQNNLHYLADDITERLGRLRTDVSEMRSHPEPARVVDSLADVALHLAEDFVPVHGVMHRIHAARTTMNEFAEAVHSLNRIADGLQKRIMQTRMVPIGPLFQRFRRVIRDLSQSTGKKVELVLHGEATELDKRMIDELVDPLTHMVRNSVDHGIEKPEERVKAGKPEHGTVTLDAFHRGRHICIQARDDGKGLDVSRIRAKIVERGLANAAQVEQMTDQEAMQYVFKPGFSTAPQVTDLSGRGMGMDIVLTKIEELNGTVELTSVPGQGATFTINLPLTLAIINAMLVRIGSEAYALPLETVVEIIQVPRSEVKYIHSQAVIRVREKVIPLVQLEQLLDLRDPKQRTASQNEPLITVLILGQQNERLGLAVDMLIGQEDIVIKDIAANYRNVDGITGASIMGDGTVSLILDVGVLLQRSSRAIGRLDSGAARSRSEVEVGSAGV